MHKMLSSAMTSRYDNTYIMHRNSNADIRYQQMFFGILALLQVQPVRDKSNKLADDVMRYLLQNFDRGITLEQMADSLNFHQAYIIRAFKKEYGMTPIEMLNHIRIGKAQQMLENTQMSTAEIAVKVGYSTPSYFARVFKKTVGLTPQAYRNEKKN